MADPLAPAALCALVKRSVGDGPESLRTPVEALAVLCHACMLAVGARLTALGEEDGARIDPQISAEHLSPLPDDWRGAHNAGVTFRYAHPQSSLQFLIKVDRMGSRTIVTGLAIDDERPCSFDVATKDYTSESFFPWPPQTSTDAQADSSARPEPLVNGYISMSRIKDFASLFKINVLQKLIPGLQKDGYVEERAATERGDGQSGRDSSARRREDPLRMEPRYDDPLRVPGPSRGQRQPRPSDWPPDFDDEYEMQGRFDPSGVPRPSFGGIGADDLRPPGIDSMDPFRRGGPGSGSGRHRGMHPTPEDILFPEGRGEGYGEPTFPSPGMPPAGARYDPVYPGDNRGDRRFRPPGAPRGPNAGPGSGFGGFGGDSMFG